MDTSPAPRRTTATAAPPSIWDTRAEAATARAAARAAAGAAAARADHEAPVANLAAAFRLCGASKQLEFPQ